MHDDIIEAPPGDTPVDLAIWLSPLQTWRSVYGNGFCEEAMRVCVERLTGLGIDAESLERAGDTVLVRGFDPRTMADTVLPGNQARHGWMHALESALVRDPVVDGARSLFSAELSVISFPQNEPSSSRGSQRCSLRGRT